MKLLFVSMLLAVFSFSLIIGLDLMMGRNPNDVLKNALNPFRVMMPAEYLILIFFILFFLIDVFRDYLSKKNGDNSSS
ncbi:hypothetical protein [Bacillus sp. UNC438CL73TsuS30]|uniref:hypothetical protein n=1 Tax=Bacillus sp. UNC438CL73TsuS30 TaxID=1340434 RepID=UPI0005547818|nr:hypothetical protein [Bacillus sp. UNC438CL73TsuS30]